jgi:hypothetical protein
MYIVKMFPYQELHRKHIEVSFTNVFFVYQHPLYEALTLPESNGKVANKFDNLPNFAPLV